MTEHLGVSLVLLTSFQLAAEELGQHIQEQHRLQAKLQASKGLRDHNVSLFNGFYMCSMDLVSHTDTQRQRSRLLQLLHCATCHTFTSLSATRSHTTCAVRVVTANMVTVIREAVLLCLEQALFHFVFITGMCKCLLPVVRS